MKTYVKIVETLVALCIHCCTIDLINRTFDKRYLIIVPVSFVFGAAYVVIWRWRM